jgi:hypothetical protein
MQPFLCSLFDLLFHATQNFPRLLELQCIYDDDDLEVNPSIPIVWLHLPEPVTKCLNSLCTNHPCVLCGTCDHYSHPCPSITQYWDALHVIFQLEVTHENVSTWMNEDPTPSCD